MAFHTPDAAGPVPLSDLEGYVALPRLTGLALSPDGSRLAVAVQAPDDDRTAYATSLWAVDPAGVAPSRRLTRGAKGESSPVFTSAGDLLFVATRPVDGQDDPAAQVWRLPASGGEAHVLARRPAGIAAVRAASRTETVVVTADTLPRAADETAERELRRRRRESRTSAILHTGYPVRDWDHELGPGYPRVFVIEGDPPPPAAEDRPHRRSGLSDPEPVRGTRDLTPDAGAALEDVVVAPDGTFVVAVWVVPEDHAGRRATLVRIDTATGARTTLYDEGPGGGYAGSPVVGPDGHWVAFTRETRATGSTAPRRSLWIARSDGAAARELAPGWDRWPTPAGWLPDGSAVVAVADDHGDSPVFLVPVAPTTSGADVVRLTGDGVFTDVAVAPDGRSLYALHARREHPAEPVRIDLGPTRATASVVPLRGPAPRPGLPGRAESVSVTVADPDGARCEVHGWLALPEGASVTAPAPLLLWVHGGPLSSWGAWSWRWNPWLMVAQGYAVLLPDPALSTGYGQAFVQRGWGQWGQAPFTDLMTITDAVAARPDIDATRTAAMGASFGGYMANWIAGHTDRFRAIVTHAGLWALDQFGPTTDTASYWRQEMTPEMAHANSPHRFVADIRTPMLVVHGDHDYRVPVGEGLRLWYELLSASGLPADESGRSPHRFLSFPDENHWVLAPQHAAVWYETIGAFLARHVLDEDRDDPEILG
ncbi:S9 family peptidase [Propionicicella superfundia]|uniref:S9 family peptidase n=1 Tax=Propionicicella superfundia TaxID=348582 RepID=UPI000687ED63|nr:prolyl oligopeptidase family serine peptidase [Propionicicella superfundia]